MPIEQDLITLQCSKSCCNIWRRIIKSYSLNNSTSLSMKTPSKQVIKWLMYPKPSNILDSKDIDASMGELCMKGKSFSLKISYWQNAELWFILYTQKFTDFCCFVSLHLKTYCIDALKGDNILYIELLLFWYLLSKDKTLTLSRAVFFSFAFSEFQRRFMGLWNTQWLLIHCIIERGIFHTQKFQMKL